MRTLYLDLGNTQLKYCSSHNHTIKACDYDDMSIVFSEAFDVIKIASVQHDHHFQQVRSMALNTNASVYEAMVSDVDKMRCGYALHHKLGVDRWLAILGSTRYCSKAVIVDSGTATTIDITDDANHLGGFILPGLDMMQDTLLTRTARVSERSDVYSLKPGSVTAEAVTNAALLSHIATIEHLCRIYPQHQLLLTGGASTLLESYLANAKRVDSLVFDGFEFVTWQAC